jgi:hypothetical protein
VAPRQVAHLTRRPRPAAGNRYDESTAEDTTHPPLDDVEQPVGPRILVELPSTFWDSWRQLITMPVAQSRRDVRARPRPNG